MIQPAVSCANNLGESPVWCWRTNQLFWTDIRAKCIHVLRPETGETRKINTPEFVAAIGLHSEGGLILGMLSTIVHYTLDGEFRTLTDVEPVSLGNRGNDGRVDRDGRFWFGTMSNTTRTPEGFLYVYDGINLVKKRSSIIVPNALCWSPDAETMYFADSWAGEIEIWRRDVSSGEYKPDGKLLQKGTLLGVPDGAIVDSEGCLWNARYGGGCVARISPGGEVLKVLDLPTKQVTSCALGGSKLQTLYVTSATQRMSEDQLAGEPEAGSLFEIDVDVPGLPEPEFKVAG